MRDIIILFEKKITTRSYDTNSVQKSTVFVQTYDLDLLNKPLT